jgi:hypothetical protein
VAWPPACQHTSDTRRSTPGSIGSANGATAGWREVRSRRWVWSLIVSFSGYHTLVLPALFVFGPVVAQQSRGGAVAWGVISVGFGIGAVFGSVLALRWRPGIAAQARVSSFDYLALMSGG